MELIDLFLGGEHCQQKL